MEISLKHHFLIAMPSLADSFFYRSVVYICEHDADGAMGLIINHPTQIKLDELLTQLNIDNPSHQNQATPILLGGPIQKGQGMILHNGANNWQSSIQIVDDVVLTTSTDILKVMGGDNAPEHALIALGHSGWGAGQLEQELAENSWLTVAANNDVLFNTPSNQCWHLIII